jgi:hypothetical protein
MEKNIDNLISQLEIVDLTDYRSEKTYFLKLIGETRAGNFEERTFEYIEEDFTEKIVTEIVFLYNYCRGYGGLEIDEDFNEAETVYKIFKNYIIDDWFSLHNVFVTVIEDGILKGVELPVFNHDYYNYFIEKITN